MGDTGEAEFITNLFETTSFVSYFIVDFIRFAVEHPFIRGNAEHALEVLFETGDRIMERLSKLVYRSIVMAIMSNIGREARIGM